MRAVIVALFIVSVVAHAQAAHLREYATFIGNPGSGKSSCANAVVGEAIFKSGVCLGHGMTADLQQHQVNGTNLWIGDTPGLSDVDRRPKAAKEIAEALRKGEGDHKLVFVVTLESGRVRPDDVTTIQLVLDAIHINETIFYGVIINKLEESIMRKLNISAARDIVTSSLSTIGKTVMFPLMVPHIPQLFGAENEVNEGLGVLVRDFVDMLPPNRIKRENIVDIKHDAFEKKREAYQKVITELNESNAKLAEHQKALTAQLEAAQKAIDDYKTSRRRRRRRWRRLGGWVIDKALPAFMMGL